MRDMVYKVLRRHLRHYGYNPYDTARSYVFALNVGYPAPPVDYLILENPPMQ